MKIQNINYTFILVCSFETFPLSTEHITRIKNLLFWYTATQPAHLIALMPFLGNQHNRVLLYTNACGTGEQTADAVGLCVAAGTTASLGSQRWAAIALMVGVLQWMATGFLGQTGQEGKAGVALPIRKAGMHEVLPRDGWWASYRSGLAQSAGGLDKTVSRSVFQSQQLYNSSLYPSNRVPTNLIWGEPLEVESLFDNLHK